MPKFNAIGTATIVRDLGTFHAEPQDDAKLAARESFQQWLSTHCEDATIESVIADPDKRSS